MKFDSNLDKTKHGLREKGDNFSLIWLGFMVEEEESIFGSQLFKQGEGEIEKKIREKEGKRKKRSRRKSMFGNFLCDVWNFYGIVWNFGLEISYVMFGTHAWNSCFEFMLGISLFVWNYHKSFFV